MTCPRCRAAIAPRKLARHLAMHDAPPPTQITASRRGITRYACGNGCVVTGDDAPLTCKHGGPALLAWRNFEIDALVYLAPDEYPTGPEYWSPGALAAILRSLPDATKPA